VKDTPRRLLAGIAGLFGNTPDSSVATPVVIEKDKPMDEQFENRNGLHFCSSCGWCNDIPTTFRKRTITDDNGKPKTVYTFLDVDNPVNCPRCAKKSVYPVCQATTTKAVIYLLKALQ
jgi:hypothetical protein